MSESSISMWTLAVLVVFYKLFCLYSSHRNEKNERELNRLYRQRAKDAAMRRNQLTQSALPQQRKDGIVPSIVKKRKAAAKKNDLSRTKAPAKTKPTATPKQTTRRPPRPPSPPPSPPPNIVNTGTSPTFCQPVAERPESRRSRNTIADGINPWEPQHRNILDALATQEGNIPYFHIPLLPRSEQISFTLKRLAKEFKPIIQKRGYNVLFVSEMCCCSDGTNAALGEGPNRDTKIKARIQGASEDQCSGFNRSITTKTGRKANSIHLRLRDRVNHYRFANYDQVVTTMCHELAHCVHPNHSPAFWTLFREIKQEYLDQTATGTILQTMSSEEQFGGFDIYGTFTGSVGSSST